jgi:hypothetical protein
MIEYFRENEEEDKVIQRPVIKNPRQLQETTLTWIQSIAEKICAKVEY